MEEKSQNLETLNAKIAEKIPDAEPISKIEFLTAADLIDRITAHNIGSDDTSHLDLAWGAQVELQPTNSNGDYKVTMSTDMKSFHVQPTPGNELNPESTWLSVTPSQANIGRNEMLYRDVPGHCEFTVAEYQEASQEAILAPPARSSRDKQPDHQGKVKNLDDMGDPRINETISAIRSARNQVVEELAPARSGANAIEENAQDWARIIQERSQKELNNSVKTAAQKQQDIFPVFKKPQTTQLKGI